MEATSRVCIPIILVMLVASAHHAYAITAKEELKQEYEYWSAYGTDMREHLPVLAQLAQQCSSVVEIGLRDMHSTWGILHGLSESSTVQRSYTGIDLVMPDAPMLYHAHRLAKDNKIVFDFVHANDMTVDIDSTDMLFIDSLHTYCHLTYELEKFSSKVRMYIVMHDTSYPWGMLDDSAYCGNYIEYPAHINRKKRGLWAAVEDFLCTHPEWQLHERRRNSHGLTILKRVQSSLIK